MTSIKLTEKIIEFLSNDNWKKFPTFEHALQKWTEELLAEERAELEKENAELKERVKQQSDRITELTQELDDYINRFK